MSIRVLAPGLLTTLQDGGRHGWRHLGVGAAGALDGFSHAVANRLVGNAADAPALEITLAGPRLRFDRAVRIAICGAEIDAHADDAATGSEPAPGLIRGPGQALPGWRRIDLPAATTLAFGGCRRGARAYLAIAGGFAAPRVLGSASTDLRGGFGGPRGRALAAGDVLSIATAGAPHSLLRTPDQVRDGLRSGADALAIAPWWIDPAPDLDFAQKTTLVRVLPGRDALAPADALFAREWRVAPASDRQGLRLQSLPRTQDQRRDRLSSEQEALALAAPRERVSEPVAPGTIQMPPDGGPIVLLADAQTHGGYPRIGHAIRADRPRLAQLRPGDALRFVPCTDAEARALACEQQQRLARIGYAVERRVQPGF